MIPKPANALPHPCEQLELRACWTDGQVLPELPYSLLDLNQAL